MPALEEAAEALQNLKKDDITEIRSFAKPPPVTPTPYTLNSQPYTLHPTPNTLHPTPYTLHPKP